MMKNLKQAYILGAFAIILIIGNILLAIPDDFNLSFWLRLTAVVMVLVSVISSIRKLKKKIV